MSVFFLSFLLLPIIKTVSQFAYLSIALSLLERNINRKCNKIIIFIFFSSDSFDDGKYDLYSLGAMSLGVKV